MEITHNDYAIDFDPDLLATDPVLVCPFKFGSADDKVGIRIPRELVRALVDAVRPPAPPIELPAPEQESHLVWHARRELELAGLFAEDSDYGGELGRAILDVVRAFASHGHSGFSAKVSTDILQRLLRFKTLTPLTDDPADWMDVSDYSPSGPPTWQCKRQSSVFSLDGGRTHYDIDADGVDGDTLRMAGWVVVRMFPGRPIVRISRSFGVDAVDVEFKDGAVELVTRGRILAAVGEFHGDRATAG